MCYLYVIRIYKTHCYTFCSMPVVYTIQYFVFLLLMVVVVVVGGGVFVSYVRWIEGEIFFSWVNLGYFSSQTFCKVYNIFILIRIEYDIMQRKIVATNETRCHIIDHRLNVMLYTSEFCWCYIMSIFSPTATITTLIFLLI